MKVIESIDILSKYELFEELWTPKIIGSCNGQLVKIAKVKDSFVWHAHEHEDELFMVYKGTLFLELRDNTTVSIKPGQMYVVPRGIEHRPYTEEGEEVWIMMFEPASTLNTGDAEANELTARDLESI